MKLVVVGGQGQIGVGERLHPFRTPCNPPVVGDEDGGFHGEVKSQEGVSACVVVVVRCADHFSPVEGLRHLREDIGAIGVRAFAVFQRSLRVAARAFRAQVRCNGRDPAGLGATFPRRRRLGRAPDLRALGRASHGELSDRADTFIHIAGEDREQLRLHRAEVAKAQQCRATHRAPGVREQRFQRRCATQVPQSPPGGEIANTLALSGGVIREDGDTRGRVCLMRGLDGGEAQAGLRRGEERWQQFRQSRRFQEAKRPHRLQATVELRRGIRRDALHETLGPGSADPGQRPQGPCFAGGGQAGLRECLPDVAGRGIATADEFVLGIDPADRQHAPKLRDQFRHAHAGRLGVARRRQGAGPLWHDAEDAAFVGHVSLLVPLHAIAAAPSDDVKGSVRPEGKVHRAVERLAADDEILPPTALRLHQRALPIRAVKIRLLEQPVIDDPDAAELVGPVRRVGVEHSRQASMDHRCADGNRGQVIFAGPVPAPSMCPAEIRTIERHEQPVAVALILIHAEPVE